MPCARDTYSRWAVPRLQKKVRTALNEVGTYSRITYRTFLHDVPTQLPPWFFGQFSAHIIDVKLADFKIWIFHSVIFTWVCSENCPCFLENCPKLLAATKRVQQGKVFDKLSLYSDLIDLKITFDPWLYRWLHGFMASWLHGFMAGLYHVLFFVLAAILDQIRLPQASSCSSRLASFLLILQYRRGTEGLPEVRGPRTNRWGFFTSTDPHHMTHVTWHV